MKRKIYLLIAGSLLMAGTSVFAQKENVGIGTSNPDASAVLDLQSSNKGLLIPRMSLEQRKNINRPATGLMIYQTSENPGFYFYNGNDWKPLTEATEDAKSVAFDADNWGLNGNAVLGTNFLGTTNTQPLRFKVNSTNAGLIDYSATSRNTFIGFQAGLNSELRNFNTAIGYQALTATPTAASGSSTQNVAIGTGTMRNATGSGNVGVGNFALSSSTGSFNLAIGTGALQSNIGGSNNTAIGASASFTNSSGSSNLAIGSNALNLNSGGSFNVAMGQDAGRSTTGSSSVFIGYQAGRNETGDNKLYISNNLTSAPLIKGDFAANNLQVNSKTTGYLAIGDFTTATSASPGTGGLPLPANIGQANGYRLVVQDGILCEKVKVALRATGSTDWADYVFEPEYQSKMMSLEEIEKYINTNKHLPNVPSTAEVQKEGLDFHQTSKMFMEKIEELTLYMIEMKKEINTLKSKNESLKMKK
jgi:hypothetical protein